MDYIEILCANGPRLPSQYAKYIGDGIYELRPEFGGTEMRLFYFAFVDDLIVILHGCKKPTSHKAFAREFDLARTRKKDLTE